MNPACDISPDELIAYTEEDLPEHRMRQLQAHVPACPACQHRLAEQERIGNMLRSTLPEPPDYARHDLMVRLYQEAEGQQDRPHRQWGQVASLTAICGTFLLAAVLLWSGLGQFVDVLRSPFQEARPDQTSEWVTTGDDATDAFASRPIPDTLGEEYPLDDNWVQSGIRTIVYQTGDEGATPIEVSQYFSDDAEPPEYMTQTGTIDGVAVYVDDPTFIREVHWFKDGLVNHAEMYVPAPAGQERLTKEEAEAIVQAFLDEG